MSAPAAGQVVWEPTPERVERARVTGLMRRHGIGSLAELRRRSVADPRWFWDSVVRDLGIRFERPYGEVLDTSGGAPWARWFADGAVNVASACVAGPAALAPDRPAVIGEPEDGGSRALDYAELEGRVAALARTLAERGVRRGDAVGAFLPMIPEAAVAAYAIAAIGAVYVPLFSGLGPPAVAARLREVGARAVVTADGTVRRGRTVHMKRALDEALADCPSVETVVVAGNVGTDPPMRAGRDIPWPEPVAGPLEPVATSAEEPFMVAFTSGTSGPPKGAVHVHGGFLVKVAAEVAYQTDVRAGDVALWPTDMGWIVGPWLMVGCHALGATLLMHEGAPDRPADRIWRSVERNGVTLLGVSPSLVRGIARAGAGAGGPRPGRSRLHTLASGGEPWTPEAYEWLREAAGGTAPIINLSGGTEVGTCLLSCHPVEPIKSCSLGGPALGMDVDVLDAEGRSVRGRPGELVCRGPWPGMTRGLWRDPDRYLRSYWSTYPGIWRHGDRALVDGDRHWFLLGRSDDVLSVAGKRLGPAEVESVLASHPAVAEAAAVGVPDPRKGERVWCVCTPAAGELDRDAVAAELRELVARRLGRPFTPAGVAFAADLPRTRSGKVVRRLVRAVAAGEDPGDLSAIENPEALEAIAAALPAPPPPVRWGR